MAPAAILAQFVPVGTYAATTLGLVAFWSAGFIFYPCAAESQGLTPVNGCAVCPTDARDNFGAAPTPDKKRRPENWLPVLHFMSGALGTGANDGLIYVAVDGSPPPR